ncbi:MAG: 6,7-dimethyl-8-ribityllumazine synthase [Betaproteobacteria bacterium]|nr:6,7-dimethyl-8-ribityllumazine synthase [Betaproteobacteria bacterium]
MSVELFQAEPEGEALRIGIVQSRFNEPVCTALREACLAELSRLGVSDDDIVLCSVPGALEIPFVLHRMAGTGSFDALIALGAVIRGETYHFELVANESGRGIQGVATEFGVPVANAVLTTDTDEQAMVRAPVKGAEAARVAVEMARLADWLDDFEPVDDISWALENGARD